VAVVRVEVRDADDARLLIELLEVGRKPDGDKLLGRATSAADACRMLNHWLGALASRTIDAADGEKTDR